MRIFVVCMAWVAPVMGQTLIWQADLSAVLPGALAKDCVVRTDPALSAWVIVQNDTTSKLVRINARGGIQTWDLPASDYLYSFRATADTSCVVQAGGNVTRISFVKKQEKTGNIREWVRVDRVLPDEAAGIGYEPLAQQVDRRNFWYFVSAAPATDTENEDDAEDVDPASRTLKSVVLRRLP